MFTVLCFSVSALNTKNIVGNTYSKNQFLNINCSSVNFGLTHVNNSLSLDNNTVFVNFYYFPIIENISSHVFTVKKLYDRFDYSLDSFQSCLDWNSDNQTFCVNQFNNIMNGKVLNFNKRLQDKCFVRQRDIRKEGLLSKINVLLSKVFVW